MVPGVPAAILAAGLMLGDYTGFLPGERQWCWEPATGPVVGYVVEHYEGGLDLSTQVERFDVDSCTVIDHQTMGEHLVRVRAFDENQNLGEWSEWSEGYEVRPNMDCNGDGIVSLPDFNCFRDLYGLCLDPFGYRECLP